MSTSADSVVQELHRRYTDLTSFVSADVRDRWWTVICEHYASRQFHNFEHLLKMLLLYDKFKDELKDRYATAFAIFFKKSVAAIVNERSARNLQPRL